MRGGEGRWGIGGEKKEGEGKRRREREQDKEGEGFMEGQVFLRVPAHSFSGLPSLSKKLMVIGTI